MDKTIKREKWNIQIKSVLEYLTAINDTLYSYLITTFSTLLHIIVK